MTHSEFIQQNYLVCDGQLYHKEWRQGVPKRLLDKPIGSYCGNLKKYKIAGIWGKNVLIHRAIWIALKGPIPEGHQIHHKDGNPVNNDINNLECLSTKAHADKHKKH